MKIAFEGFKSYHRRHEVEFPEGEITYLTSVNLDSPLMDGNAGGKTTIEDVVSWVLYNKIPAMPKTLDELINHKSPRMWGMLSFGGVRIERWKDRGKSTQLRYRRDGDANWTELKTDLTQAKLEEEVLGIGFPTYCNTVYIHPTSDVVSFLKTTPTNRKKVLKELVDEKFYRAAAQLAKDKVAAIDKTTDILRGKVNQWEMLESRCVAELEQIESVLQREAAAREAAAHKVALEIANCQSQIAALTTALSTAPNPAEKKDLEQRLTATDARLRNLDRHIAQESYAANTSHLKAGQPCPTCLREISLIGLAEIEQKQRTAQQRLQQLNDMKAQDQRVYNDLQAKLAHLASSETDGQVKRAQIVSLRERILSLQDTATPVQDSFLQEKAKALVAEIHDLRENIVNAKNEIARERQDYDLYVAWVHGFGKELPDMLFDRIREGLNYYGNIHLRSLIGPEYRIQCPEETSKDEFIIEIFKGKNKQDISLFSGGEGVRLRLACVMAFRELQLAAKKCPLDILFLDEYGEGLDEKGRETLDEFLRTLIAEGKFSRIVVTMPKGDLAEHRSRIHITMKGGESQIV